MTNSLYFVWRFSDVDPYRLYGIRRHIMPAADDVRCIWRGDNEDEGIEMMVKANQERRNRKQKELSKRLATNRRIRRLKEEKLKKSFWDRGAPKEGGTIFG